MDNDLQLLITCENHNFKIPYNNEKYLIQEYPANQM